MGVGQNVIGNYYLSWGNYNERDLCVRSGYISDGRVDMWRTIALEKVSIVAIFCSAAPTTPRY